MRVDFSIPKWLVIYYHIIGSISLFLNTGTILLLIFKASKMDNFRYYLLLFQIICTIVDFHLTFLQQPVPLYPLVGGYGNGFLVHLDVWCHHLMTFILIAIFAQIQCLAFCFIRKHQTIASVINRHRIPERLYQLMVFIAIAFLFVATLVFLPAAVPRKQLMDFVSIKYPDYVPEFSNLTNFALYQVDNPYVLGCLAIGIVMSTILGFTYTYTATDILKMLQQSRSKVSASSYQKQKTAIKSLFAQLATSFICLTPPVLFGIVFYLEMEHAQLIIQILLAIFSLHSSVNAIVLVATNPPFRQFVLRTGKSSVMPSQRVSRVSVGRVVMS